MSRATNTDSELEAYYEQQRGLATRMWEMFRNDVPAAAVQQAMAQDEAFRRAPVAMQQDLREFAIVMDRSRSPQERIQAAMRVHETDAATDTAAERFFSNMFSTISRDGNLENDRVQIQAIERALDGLVVNGQTLHIQADGRADNRLAALLRTPEVVEALQQAQQAGVVSDVHFRADFQLTPDNVRMNNIHEQGNER